MVRYLFYTIGDLTYQSPIVSEVGRTTGEDFLSDTGLFFRNENEKNRVLRLAVVSVHHNVMVTPGWPLH